MCLLIDIREPFPRDKFFAVHILLKCFFNLIGTTIAEIDHIFISDNLLYTGFAYLIAS